MTNPIELSLEQQFSIRSFETQVDQMSQDQAKEFLVRLYEQMIVQETLYKQFIKSQWGLEGSPFGTS